MASVTCAAYIQHLKRCQHCLTWASRLSTITCQASLHTKETRASLCVLCARMCTAFRAKLLWKNSSAFFCFLSKNVEPLWLFSNGPHITWWLPVSSYQKRLFLKTFQNSRHKVFLSFSNFLETVCSVFVLFFYQMNNKQEKMFVLIEMISLLKTVITAWNL